MQVSTEIKMVQSWKYMNSQHVVPVGR